MFCPSCKERIPIISNITINNDNIMLIFFCQCKEENMTYNLNDYMKERKKENKKIIKYKCILHKDEDIELFCFDCIKELCYKCDKSEHISLNHKVKTLNYFSKITQSKTKNNSYFQNIEKIKLNKILKNYFVQFSDLVFSTLHQYPDNFSSIKNIWYLELVMNDLYGFSLFEKDNEIKEENNFEKIKHTKYLNVTQINIKKEIIIENNSEILFILLFDFQNHFIIYCKDFIYYIKENNKHLEIIDKLSNENTDYIFLKLKYLNKNYFCSLFQKGIFIIYKIENDKINKCFKFIPQKKILTSISFIYIKEKENLICGYYDTIFTFSIKNNFNQIKEIINESHSIIYELKYNNSKLFLSPKGDLTIQDGISNKKYSFYSEKEILILLEIKSINSLAIAFLSNYIEIYDFELKSFKKKFKHSNKILDMKEVKKEKRLISCSEDLNINIWDLTTFSCTLKIQLVIFPFNISIGKKNKIIVSSFDTDNILIID